MFIRYNLSLTTQFYSLQHFIHYTVYSLQHFIHFQKNLSLHCFIRYRFFFFLWYVIHKIPFPTVPHSLQDFIHYNVSLSALLHVYRITSSAPFMLIHWFHDVVTPTMAARQTTLSGLMIYGHIYCVQRT